MTDVKTQNNIEEIIHSTVYAVNMTMGVYKDNSGINMSYNFIGDYIGVDLHRLFIAVEEIPFPLTMELYVKILTIHELGHALDRIALMNTLERTVEIFHMKRNHSIIDIYNNLEMLSVILEEHEMNLVFEETAWINAETLNETYKIVDPVYLEFVKKHSLSTYRNSYEADLSIYNSLMEETNEQIA